MRRSGMALIDDLERMAALLSPYRERVLYDTVFGGPALLSRLPAPSPYSADRQLFGLRLQTNPMFPYEQACEKCGGTGDGVESTFCPVCKGAGRYRVDGVMTGAGNTLAAIVHYFPPKPVRWPEGVRVPRRPHPGIRAV